MTNVSGTIPGTGRKLLGQTGVSRYQKRKKHKLFCKRAGIEPTIGHLKSDYRLGRNFYKGVAGDAVNVLLAAAAYNFKRAMKALWCMLHKKGAQKFTKIVLHEIGLIQ